MPVLLKATLKNFTFCVFAPSAEASEGLYKVCFFLSSSMRKRSIGSVQGEQGTEEAPIADGWSHYSYLNDSPGNKKLKLGV